MAIPHEGSNMHRISIAPLLACALLYASASLAGDGYESAFPYEVRAASADVPLRCGPGDSFYVTELLGRGDLLTVYRQTPGGWLAVRPPEASYSLLAARYARATSEQDVMEVVDDHAVSWVGSTDTQPDDLKWQVRLKAGERVVVLGEQACQTYAGGPVELHYRIAPPAGEFRWIHERDVRHASQVKIEEPAARSDIQLTNFRVVVEETEDSPPDDGFVARRPRTATTNAPTTNAPTADDPNQDDTAPNDHRERPRSRRTAVRDRATRQADMPPLNAAEFEARRRDLDVRLSLMVAKPIADWHFDELSDEVSELIARGGTTVDRGRAQLLAEKLDEFEQLHARYQTIGIAGRRSRGAAAPAELGSHSPPPPAGVDPRFDGAGWLYPVYSKNQASPPYALLSADGTILQFVSPAPGLNLNRYLRTEVGVFGQHSAGSSLDKPHVTAQRVVSLERHRR